MKKIVVLFLLAGLYMRCSVDSSQTILYSVNEPVFTSAESFRNSVKIVSESHELGDCGKICLYDHYLYISEPGKGIHIIDNTDPSHPRTKGYIELMGNHDLIIRGNRLYADALVDLLWFDLSDPGKPVLQGRAENLFPEALPAIENEYGYDYQLCQTGIIQGKIITGWQLKERKQQNYYTDEASHGSSSYPTLSQGDAIPETNHYPVTHFDLHDSYLYAITNHRMHIIDLSGETPQKSTENIYTGNVESFLVYRDKLLMGTSSGLAIYSINDPTLPIFRSQIAHIYGCNPVAVDNDLIYATIHSGNFCWQNTNQLLIFDISNIQHPIEVASYAMNYPKGLGINQDKLFVCDAGLKIFKTGNPQTLMNGLLTYYAEIDGHQLIPYNNTIIVIADNGVYQYDCSDIKQLKLLSKIPIKR